MILTAAGRAEAAAFVGAQFTARDSRTWNTRLLRDRAAMEVSVPACGGAQERNTIMELLRATAAEAADTLRVTRSGGYRLIMATQWGSIKIGRSLRVSVASIRHVAAKSATVEGVNARTQPSGGLSTPGQAEEKATCSRHDPLGTTVDVAAFLMYGPTAARQLLQIATRRGAALAPI
jgi:hypothetical protein